MAPGSSLLVCPPMCRQRARAAPEGKAQGCVVPGIVLLLLTYLAYLALGTGVFWMLESPAAKDSSAKFQRDKWALLRNFTCLDSPALDSLIRVRDERGRPGRGGEIRDREARDGGQRATGHALGQDRKTPGALLQKKDRGSRHRDDEGRVCGLG